MELAVDLDGPLQAILRFTSRAEGDLAVGQAADLLAPRRTAVAGGPWLWLRQVHGDGVVAVGNAADAVAAAGTAADAVVCAAVGPVLAVHTADCAPVALVAGEGVIGAVHAGWRGLAAGVVQRAVDAVRSLGGSQVGAYLGPCIGPECYEFGVEDLAGLTDRYGPDLAATASTGRPALDLRAGVRAALRESGAELAFESDVCTACDPSYYSHRARGDMGRQALVVRLDRGDR